MSTPPSPFPSGPGWPPQPARPAGRPSLRAVLWSAGALAVVGIVAAGSFLWHGAAYPEVSPDEVGTRLHEQAVQAYDDMALPGTAVDPTARAGTCAYRGLRGLVRIEEDQPGVRSFNLTWRALATSREDAAAGQQRVRQRMERAGWELISDGVASELSIRYRAPKTDDTLDVTWHEQTGILTVSASSPCGQVPEDFDAQRWTERAWDRGVQGGR
ncbi:hypothetical protein ACH41E_06170 [Streptomyces sp. NPDC020412]|uniref:hypothetical protein n=1 Tax=Streptomyces sp. NPDC020412 TaxID=3365073 RepID=UPI0037995A61